MQIQRSSREEFFQQCPAEAPPIGVSEIHLWQACLRDSTDTRLSMFDCLDEREKNKYASFRNAADKNRYSFTHGALRNILSYYLGIEPKDIQYRYSPYGKPELANPDSYGLHFNMSHSQNVSLYAITVNARIGVDVEYIDDKVAFMDIARSYFSPDDVSSLQADNSRDRVKKFFKLWARKEAYLKAIGTGFYGSLPALTMKTPGSGIDDNITIVDLDIDREFVGAIAFDGAIERIKIFDFSATDNIIG